MVDMVDIQQWIKNIKIINGKTEKWRSNTEYLNYWDKLDQILRIDGEFAYYNNPSTGKRKKIALEGDLKLEGELKEIKFLIIKRTNITDLDLSKCSDLKQITVEDNLYLTSINFLTRLPNPKNLVCLQIGGNSFTDNTLDFLKPFVNLEVLRLEYGFCGSLEPLKGLKNLRNLSIRDTDIDRGWEYLNEEIKWENIHCQPSLRPNAKSKKIYEEQQKHDSASKVNSKQAKTTQNQTGKATEVFLWLGLLGLVLIVFLIVYRSLFKKKVKVQPSNTQY